MLKALDDIEPSSWQIELRCDCWHCGAPGALVRASDRGVFLSCPGDAYAEELGYGAWTRRQFQEALAAQRHDWLEAA
jgi:hypothetical protein